MFLSSSNFFEDKMFLQEILTYTKNELLNLVDESEEMRYHRVDALRYLLIKAEIRAREHEGLCVAIEKDGKIEFPKEKKYANIEFILGRVNFAGGILIPNLSANGYKFGFRNAIYCFDHAMSADKKHENTRTYWQRGYASMGDKKYDEAIDNFKTVLKLTEDPNMEFMALYMIGFTFMRSLRFDEALDYFNQVIEHGPDYAGAYILRGTTQGRLKRNSKAIADLEKAIELDPCFRDAYFRRGEFITNQDPKQAIQDFKTYKRLKEQGLGEHSIFGDNIKGFLKVILNNADNSSSETATIYRELYADLMEFPIHVKKVAESNQPFQKWILPGPCP